MRKHPKLAVFLALLFAASMWFYVQRILIPHQLEEAAVHDTPRGNLSDLYPRWLGARELLLHHRDPYSRDVTLEIQQGYYGRVLNPAHSGDPKDQQAFAYPVYVAFLLAPTIGIDFRIVQEVFRWLLIMIAAASVFMWLYFLKWRTYFATKCVLVILTLGSFPVLQGIKLQQLTLLVAGLIAVCAVLLANHRLWLAGIVLTLSTTKPQLTIIPIVCLLIWAFAGWKRRQALVWGFVPTLVALYVAGEYVLPGWVARFREALIAYQAYAGTGSVLDALLTPAAGRPLAILLVLATFVMAWRTRAAEPGSVAFQVMLLGSMVVTVIVVPKAAPYNQILLLPGILFILARGRMLWDRGRVAKAVLACSAAVLAWPWLAAFGLTVVSLVGTRESVQRAWALPLYTNFAIPLGVAAVLFLMRRESADQSAREGMLAFQERAR